MNNSRLTRWHLPRESESTSAITWYRRAKATKRRGMGAGSHSVLIVPRNSGNGTQSDPREGSETPSHGTVFGKHDECIEIRILGPRNRDG